MTEVRLGSLALAVSEWPVLLSSVPPISGGHVHMASGPSMHSPGSRALEAMPTSYTLILFLWSLPFAAVVLFLVIFYASVLILSVQGFVTELVRPSNNNGPLFFSILGTIVGAYLLAIIAKALTTVQVPQGVRLPAGAVPQLDSLIRDCTTQAGIEPPDDVFIVPDANAFAYSSGRFSLHERQIGRWS